MDIRHLPRRRTIALLSTLLIGTYAAPGRAVDKPGEASTPLPAAASAGQAAAAIKTLEIPTRQGTLTLMAPDGATAKINGRTIDVTSGRSFQLEINAGIGMLSRVKTELQDNSLNVFKRLVVDEPPLGMIYQSAVAGVDEHHIYFIVKGVLGGLVCSDTKGPVYTEAQARAMYASCKTIALKP